MPATILPVDERPAAFAPQRRAYVPPRDPLAPPAPKPAMTRAFMLIDDRTALDAQVGAALGRSFLGLVSLAKSEASEPKKPVLRAVAVAVSDVSEPTKVPAKPTKAKTAVSSASTSPPAVAMPQPTVAAGLEAKMLTFVDHQVSRGISRDAAERQALAIVANGVSPHSLADKDARALAWAMLGKLPRPRQDGDDVQARPRAEPRMWDARPSYNATTVRHARTWYGPNVPHCAPVTVRRSA